MQELDQKSKNPGLTEESKETHRYRIAFAATSAFAYPFFQELQKIFDIAFLMSKEPEPKSKSPSFAKFIQEDKINIPCYYPKKMKEINESIFDGLDAVIVIAYGHKIPKRMLDKCAWINLHGSLLPKFRGAAPINYAIMAGEKRTGLSSTIMVEQIDAGPVIDLLDIDINQDDTASSLSLRMQELGKEWFAESVLQYLKGEKAAIPQDDAIATFAPSITHADRQIDWSLSAQEVDNKIRGLSKMYCSSIKIDQISLKLISSEVFLDEELTVDGVEVGQLVDPHRIRKLIIRCGSGFVQLKKVIPEGSKEMDDSSFIRGHRGAFRVEKS